MRSKEEVFRLIKSFADEHESMRAVVLNGSRANPKSKADPFQDYDIACHVKEVSPFKRQAFIHDYFGGLLIPRYRIDASFKWHDIYLDSKGSRSRSSAARGTRSTR